MVDLSLIGETVLDWNEEDMNIYHKKRLEVDSLLSLFKSSYRSERIDSVCRLLAEKENLLNKIMLTVTHELRTPLTAINGYGELLAQTENENKRIEYPKTK